MVGNPQVSEIQSLLDLINKKMADDSLKMYNKIVFGMLNIENSFNFTKQLLLYKDILTIRLTNPEYLEQYTLEDISSRIIVLIKKPIL